MQKIQVRPRVGGKTPLVKVGDKIHFNAQQAMLVERAGRVHRIILPMDPAVRRAHYIAQNTRRAGIVAGGGEGMTFTAAQHRRMRKKDKLSRPYRAPEQAWAESERIDNQHQWTPRVGRKRFGAAVSRDGLDKLFSRILVPLTGKEVRRNG